MARPSQPESEGPDPRYEPRDARRESWINPTEDSPPEVPFDRKVTTLRTQAELEAWITVHGCKDLFEFIRYAAEQHDAEVTTHNELVDMVDDAAATVRRLEETLAQKDTLSRQGSPAVQEVAAPKRSTKLPDPPIFENKEQDIDNWLSRMRNKLKANSDHYHTEEMKIAYTESRIGGDAAKHIAPRMRDTALNRFETAEEIFEYLYQVFGDPDRRHTAQRLYSKLYQGKKPFAEFWAEFQRLSAELDYNQASMIDDLRYKLSPALQNALINVPDPIDIYDFARTCQRVDQRLREIQTLSARVERGASLKTATPPGGTTLTPQATTAGKDDRIERVSRRTPHPDPERENLLRTGSCFTCKKPGHRAAECPLKATAKTIHELEGDSGNDLPPPETR